MAAGRKSDFTLSTKSLDDLFSTQEERDEAKLKKIFEIPIELIDNFPDHPFQVRDDGDMRQLVESIKERGVITPATVRQKEGGRYELIAGHRRKRACELARLETLRCEVVELNRDEATILMVESNFHRSQMLPSEKAFSYRMRLDAMKRQGQRTDLTLSPVGTKLRSSDKITAETGDSKNQIHRYIRLTYLHAALLKQVDDGKLSFRAGVELSYLSDVEQEMLHSFLESSRSKAPSLAQSARLRALSSQGQLDKAALLAVMSKPIANTPIVSIPASRLKTFFPSGATQEQMEEIICAALEYYWNNHTPASR